MIPENSSCDTHIKYVFSKNEKEEEDDDNDDEEYVSCDEGQF